MLCLKCQFENPIGINFCGECGAKLERLCPSCNTPNPIKFKFCGKCGYNLKQSPKIPEQKTKHKNLPSHSLSKKSTIDCVAAREGERKHVTVLFSDLTGYTSLSESLDPEEVKEITTHIFNDISKIIGKYDGFIEKFAGDAVMAIFGAEETHEDDPIRAIKAARELHTAVENLSPTYHEKIGRPLSMHTGINTGLVVTGEVSLEKGTHGIVGNTINIASRLCSLAKPGQILVDLNTHCRAEGYFTFESLGPIMVKGKAEPVLAHKVISQRDIPFTIRRISGLRADLIGRKVELGELLKAIENLNEGKGRIFSICGDAGTGKSRLVEEFKATLDLKKIQWIEGHAYEYSQNIPYFPLIDLLNRVFCIDESDSSDNVREKLESGIERLVGKKDDLSPYVGNLYSLIYPEIEEVSPEFWRSRLQEAVRIILTALADNAPTVFFLEDLHWADPSFVELLRLVCLKIREPAIVLCVYRPIFTLFTSHQISNIGKLYHEIRLKDLSLSDAQDMLESLLKTGSIPTDLKRFVQGKAEGNPFYLEELVNSLIESEALIKEGDSWKIAGSIAESKISSSIHGIISGRLDRLEREAKRILQEASVIGRAFYYDILKKVTELKDRVDRELNILERVDLIKTRTIQPDLEYMFKHPITQEVVYNGLLKKERQDIHEQIALVMEDLFQDRLPEFYETLAFHFKRGNSVLKAVDYLMRSGKKSARRYAIEESHEYYNEAFELLTYKSERSERENQLLIDLLIEWAYVYYYRAHFNDLIDLFKAHENLAGSLKDKAKQGMFNAWLGLAFFMNGSGKVAHRHLRNALKIGEEIGNQQVIGYSCAWLAWSYWRDIGNIDKAIICGERAHEIAKSIESDQYLYFKPLAAIGLTTLSTGDWKRALAVGKNMLDYGKKHSNVRSISLGYISIAFGHQIVGDFKSAIESYRQAIKISVDPTYSEYARGYLGAAYLFTGQVREAEKVLEESLAYCKRIGYGIMAIINSGFLGAVYVFKGRLNKGFAMLENATKELKEKGNISAYALFEVMLANVYLHFIDSDFPSVGEKAENHLKKAIKTAKETGAKYVLSQAYLNLGLLYKAKGRPDQARRWLTESIQIFELCRIDFLLKQAKEALESL